MLECEVTPLLARDCFTAVRNDIKCRMCFLVMGRYDRGVAYDKKGYFSC